MPKNTQPAQTSQETQTVNYETFDIARLGFVPMFSPPDQTQVISIPRYLYDETKQPTKDNIEKFGKPLVIISDPIKLTKGGPPPYNEKYHGPNPDSSKTAFFYVPEIESDQGSNNLFSVINQIDEFMNNEINIKKNKSGILETFKNADKKSRIPVNGLRYTELAKLLEPSIGGKEFEPYKRLKVKFSSGAKYDKNKNTSTEESQNETFPIDTQIYVGDEPEPRDCKTLTDVRQYFKWGCTAKFAIVFNKIWMLKSGDKKCGITAKCVQLCVTEQAPEKTQGVTMQFKSSLFAKQPAKLEVKNEEKVKPKVAEKDDNDDDDDDDEEEEEEEEEEVKDDDEEQSEPDSDDDKPAKKPEPKKPEPAKKPEPKKQEPAKKQEPTKTVKKQFGKA